MNLRQVRDHFEEEASVYDSLIDRLIPGYQEQNRLMLALIPFDRSHPITALDLGAGTGVLSYLLLTSFPQARVTAFDLADNMLEACRSNLSAFADRLVLKQGNFATDDIGGQCDVVVSGLSTHHLDDAGKRELYGRIFHALNPGGVFLNREIVLGACPHLTDRYHALWREFMALNGEDDEYWFAKYKDEDIPASVEEQITWLRNIGFADVGCHWRHLNFAVFGGTRPPDLDA